MTAYYNDTEPYVCEWLRNLIEAGHLTPGDVDERPIEEVSADDLRGYDRCHLFAGIGGWELALALAGWPEDRSVWTGSCPCQPFSVAGKGEGEADARHLWPAFHRLIVECRPPVVFGEQVAGPAGYEWLAGVRADLERTGYAVGAADLPAACAIPLHKRQRLFWVADADTVSHRPQGRTLPARSKANEWAHEFERLVSREVQSALPTRSGGSLADVVSCRVGRLRAYGNAIVPQVAAVFVRAFMDCRP